MDVLGGKAGANSRFTKNSGTPSAVELGDTDLVTCAPGDVIRIQGSAGGGQGNPFEREIEKVRDDVRAGFVSLGRACEAQGVVVDATGSVDEAATQALRARQPQPESHFDFGPGRERFESVWTLARYATLTRILTEIPAYLWSNALTSAEQHRRVDRAVRLEDLATCTKPPPPACQAHEVREAGWA
ncbi:hypothetical protein [Variovorax sp. JS1663]|uniref:hypothetical protein n=1 Tax=Variovorax sp. JS1663 TaxID=1851577 RepID=UPI000B343D01|nr:hypothetical protein [Variovorax sp. JS1663]OUL99467.1 hypothetical protein A8M77_26145 [Variovorax sp. JS1663]